MDDFGRSNVAIMCWNISNDRCSFVYGRKEVDPIMVGYRACAATYEFWNALENNSRTPATSMPADNVQIWSCPDANCFKINCDGSFCRLEEEAGIGVVGRNENGELIDGFCATVRAPDAVMTEAYALRKACMVATSFRSVGVTVETDCKELFDAVTGVCKASDWRLAPIHYDVQCLRSAQPSLRLGLITRQENKAADWVAKSAAKRMCPVG